MNLKLSHQLGAPNRAVVDIGSNSVRLVVYTGPSRAPVAIFNEKALCGLGRNMTEDRRLNGQAVADSLAILARFRALIDEFGVEDVHVIGTSAVREAVDGKKFIAAVREVGFDIDVVSGRQEANLAALGVISFEPGASGVVGDMGGGSLELVEVAGNAVREAVSMPIGPLSLMRESENDIRAARKIISKSMKSAPFLKDRKNSTLYAVGGAWRAVARIHMGLRHYSLSVLHHYELTRRETVEICELISKQSRASLEEIPGIPKRRIDTLPYASAVLEAVLDTMNADRVIVSSGGVREGVLFDQLSKSERKLDPLLEACRFYAAKLAPAPDYGDAVFPVIEPVFVAMDPDGSRRRYAVSLMNDIGAYFHPDLRARRAFDTALGAPLIGLNHADRVWIALALFCRHEGRPSAMPDEPALGLLSWEDRQTAINYGLALRFASAFSPKLAAPLEGCKLMMSDGKLIFSAPESRKSLMGETPRKRLNALAASLDAEPVEHYD